MPRLPLALALLAAGPVAAQSPEIVRFRLADTDTTWLTQTRCTDALADGTRACRRVLLSQSDDDADSVRFTVERGNTILNAWLDEEAPYQSHGFDLVRTDLNGDGRAEHVIAHHVSEGNGLGVRWWTLYIVDDRAMTATPLRLGSEEHGDDAFVRTAQGMRLLVGSWEDGTDPRRGPGLYFTGRLYRYDAGRLVPDEAQPVRRRRYLNSFADERGRQYLQEEARGQRGVPGQTPWRWLQHPSTQRLAADPAMPPARRRLSAQAGRYLGPQVRDGVAGPAFLPDGETVPHQMATHIFQNGRLLPAMYVPAGGWPREGVPARLLAFAPYDGPPRDTGGEPMYRIELDR